MSASVWALAAAAFAMITTEFNIVGLVPLIAADLEVPVSKVGLLVTAYGLTVAVTSPFLTMAASRFERRRLFAAVLLLTAAGNTIAAAATGFEILALGRVVAALALPAFWSMASETAARIAGPERAGRAVATVFSGISVASVVGTPLTTLLASASSWRWAFAASALVCVVMAAVIFRVFPRLEPDRAAPRLRPGPLLREPVFLGHLLMTALSICALLTAYTYLADTLTRLGGLGPSTVAWALMGFGAVGIAGNSLAGRLLDTVGPLRVALVAVAAAGLSMYLFAPLLEWKLAAALVLAVWGTAHAAGFVATHVRVMKAAPVGQEALAAALSVTFFNTGIAGGALVGGQVIDHIGLAAIGTAAGLVAVAALVVGGVLSRARPSSLPIGQGQT
ncbi:MULTISPECIES: MFS transporter [unclassified Variovorax]|uniref:MFS transporter n=1 Tax=unclassified Variovorax TaxID=663243 RepID=UPI003ECEEED3